MRIVLEVYLPFRGRSWWKGEEEVSPGTTPEQVAQTVGLAGRQALAVLVNGRYPDMQAPLTEGDILTFVRRSEGG